LIYVEIEGGGLYSFCIVDIPENRGKGRKAPSPDSPERIVPVFFVFPNPEFVN